MKNKGAYLVLILEVALICVLHAIRINEDSEKPVVSNPEKAKADMNVLHARTNSHRFTGVGSFLQISLLNGKPVPSTQ